MIVGHPWHLTHLCYSNVPWLPCDCRSARGGTGTSDPFFSTGALLFAFPIRTYHFSTALVLMWYVYWTIGLPCIFGMPAGNMGKKWHHCIFRVRNGIMGNIYSYGSIVYGSIWWLHRIWLHLVTALRDPYEIMSVRTFKKARLKTDQWRRPALLAAIGVVVGDLWRVAARGGGGGVLLTHDGIVVCG